MLPASTSSKARPPGDGAARLDEPPAPRHYVYVARSRRAGGPSLGIDLTPQGFCSFACVYCQASHPPIKRPELTVDVPALRAELERKLSSALAPSLRDLVLAGSGEPTAATNLAEVVDAVLETIRAARFAGPLRIFTNGRHFSDAAVAESLLRWAREGGEIWVKLDGGTTETLSRMSGRRLDAAMHLEPIWRFAASHALGVQSMLVIGPSLPTPHDVVDEIASALGDGLSRGAKITEVHLLTLSRSPADPERAAALRPVGREELARYATVIRRRTGLAVRVFGADGDT
jgi:wyosine [tRNA(Phe)-imidazoG37] synthetase (radical SAM superfamily)